MSDSSVHGDSADEFMDEDELVDQDELMDEDERMDEDVAANSDEPTENTETSESLDEGNIALIPREYQIEILEAAKKRNTIACLGTGTGKTYIAVLLIKEMAYHVLPPFAEGGKRIFFLVPTVPLVKQQTEFIAKHTELKVKGYIGEMNVDKWSEEHWGVEFENQQVLVMTGEIGRMILHHSFLPVSRLCLLILDECHQARGKSPYSEVLKYIFASEDKKPMIFGLSASLINDKCKPSQLKKELDELQTTLQSTIETASNYQDVQKYGADPKAFVVSYDEESELPLPYKSTIETFNRIQTELKQKEKNEKECADYADKFFRRPEQCLSQVVYILRTMGTWCAYYAAEKFCKRLKKYVPKKYDTEDAIAYNQVLTVLEDFIKLCEQNNAHDFPTSLRSMPHKMKKMLDTFSALKEWNDKVIEYETNQAKTMDIKFNKDPHLYCQNLKALNSNASSLCGIVFVEQRITAYILCKWLHEISKVRNEFEFVKPEYMVGQGNTGYEAESYQTSMSAKKQHDIIQKFAEKEINFLVSTSVLEEGIDVQKCNFVIRFDFPKNFKSYIQSKGRARAKHSLYVLFMPHGNLSSLVYDLNNYVCIEHLLTKGSQNSKLSLPAEEMESVPGDTIPPYQPTTAVGSPMISEGTAVPLIYRYCSKLPCDMAVKLTPQFIFTTVDDNADAVNAPVKCVLYLPINSALHEPITVFAQNKCKARRAAAMEACKKLHQINEFNDHLLPISNAVDNAADELGLYDDEEDCKGGPAPGTKKRVQKYNKGVARVFKDCLPMPGVPCYLHVFILNLVVPLPKCLNPKNRPIVNPADTVQGFGLLSTKKLPKVCKFPIFGKVGKIAVDVYCVEQPLFLDENQLHSIAKFHEFLFTDTLLMLKRGMQFSPSLSEFSCYIVPINKVAEDSGYYIDVDFMNSTFSHDYNDEKNMSDEQFCRKKFNAYSFNDAIVVKFYARNDEKRVFYHVSEITQKTPLSMIDDPEDFTDGKATTFREYYLEKYNIRIEHDDQPLLLVRPSQTLHMAKPLYISAKQIFKKDQTGIMSKTKLRRTQYSEYLVPELCLIHPFRDPMFRKATYLPTILFRLNSLLSANEIRQDLARASLVGTNTLSNGFSWPVFNLESSDEKLRQHLIFKGEIKIIENYDFLKESSDILKDSSGNISSFEVKVDLRNHPGPSPARLLQALTTTSANDEFNLERLETIGDSFLKCASSIKLFAKYPGFDEGKLTRLRIKVICNRNLYRLFRKKNLAESMIHSPFYCENSKKKIKNKIIRKAANWLPPCYSMDKGDFLPNQLSDNDEGADKVEENFPNSTIKGSDEKMKKSDNDEVADKVEENFPNSTIEGSGEKMKKKEREKNQYCYQWISDKCLADSAEALIGAYLLSCGCEGALRFMHWLGVSPFMELEDGTPDFKNWPPVPVTPLRQETSKVQSMENLLNFSEFEKRIGYKFKQPAYLLQAFTHTSYGIYFNDLTDCYQRLEFVGDAILDYLVTRRLYEEDKKYSPGELTDLRAALVNNSFFASLAIKYGFHKNLRSTSVTLGQLINKYVSVVECEEDKKYFEECEHYLEDIECIDPDEIEVPKALGDIFESVAGAIYLDSGCSLDTVWKIYHPMLKPAIEHFSVNVPKSPVRLLHELCSDRKDLFDDVVIKDGKTYICIRYDGMEFGGFGPNKRVAKSSVAKKILLYVKKKRRNLQKAS